MMSPSPNDDWILRRLGEADLIQVLGGVDYDGPRPSDRPLFTTNSPSEISRIVRALEFGDGPWMDWMTLGDLTISFYSAGDTITHTRLLAPDYLRGSGLWSGDAPLRNPALLQDILTEAATTTAAELLTTDDASAVAANIRQLYALDSGRRVEVLHSCGVPLPEAKAAVEATLSDHERRTTSAMQSDAIAALGDDSPDRT